MCGIAGLFGNPDLKAIQAMVTAMKHRGPDDHGIFTDETVALGQARLSIIDLSPAGHQPMSNADQSIWIVFNGEIYNFRSERAGLEAKGRTFRSTSDTEVILALYEEYGEDFLKRLRGLFALAIYDKRRGPKKEKLILARDHLGIKPLLYRRQGGVIVFASELKALLASGVSSRQVDHEALRTLLTFGSVYQPRTLLADVSALPSAHYLVADDHGIRIQRYWSFGANRISELGRASYPEQVAFLKRTFVDTVKMQLVADVPVGAFLSGGVDSSLIAAIMAKEIGEQVKTFSVGFESAGPTIDESKDAEEIARYIGSDHHLVYIGPQDIEDHLEHFVSGLDQPSVDGLNSYFVSHWTSRFVKVALSGTGGDELFAGYPWFAQMWVWNQKQVEGEQRGKLHKALARAPWLAPLLNGFLPRNKRPASAFREAYAKLYHCFGPVEGGRLLSNEMREKAMVRASMAEDLILLDEIPNEDVLDRTSVLCLNGYTRNQLLRDIDACSMAHSLEVRVPYLDPFVTDVALSLPPASKLQFSSKTLNLAACYSESGCKKVLVDVARDYLPAIFFEQRCKRGFGLPYDAWLRGPLAELLADVLSPPAVKAGGLLDPEVTASVYEGYMKGLRPWNHPWLLMVIELWRRLVLEKI
ncbi:MAG: asparagine synthase (glutamine-hydrolyzing) [Deltaproteobacteria bacterium]|nr:asparagine synthase (glutamine-hydrolyzing) [Deltaproteobacteria bacterium]